MKNALAKLSVPLICASLFVSACGTAGTKSYQGNDTGKPMTNNTIENTTNPSSVGGGAPTGGRNRDWSTGTNSSGASDGQATTGITSSSENYRGTGVPGSSSYSVGPGDPGASGATDIQTKKANK